MRSERRQQNRKRLQHRAFVAFQSRQLVKAYHKRADGSIEREILYIVRNFLYRLVKRFKLVFRGRFVGNAHLAGFLVEEHVPVTAQELVLSVYSVRIPRLGLFQRSEEHLVHTQSIGAVTFDDIVGINDVEHRLRHFFDRPSADILPVFENKLRIGELRPPCAESVNVENVVADYVHVHMQFLSFVTVLESVRNELVRADDPVNEIRTSLNHTLIDEFLERFRLADVSEIVQEHIPEPRIHEVACSVFDTSDVKVYVLPIFVGLFGYQLLVVMRVHVTQVVSRRSSKTGHRTQFERLSLYAMPALDTCKRRFAAFGRRKIRYFRKLQRKLVFSEYVRHSVAVINRYRLSPITLAREYGITQAVVYLSSADPAFLHFIEHFSYGFLNP